MAVNKPRGYAIKHIPVPVPATTVNGNTMNNLDRCVHFWTSLIPASILASFADLMVALPYLQN